MISNLQLLRGIAALGVVIYHTNITINGTHSDLMGVAIFFVISGFIMVHVTRTDADRFLAKRLVRIVPLYWIFTIGTLAWFGFGFANPPVVYPLWFNWIVTDPGHLSLWFAAQARALNNLDTWTALARSLSFWPTAQDPRPILGVGWTLNIEMFFYLLFACSLRIDRAKAPLIASVVLLILCITNSIGLVQSKVIATFGHSHVVYFVFGMIIFYLWQTWAALVSTYRTAAIALSFCVLISWLITCLTPSPFSALQYVMPPAVVVAFLVLHSADLRIGSRLLIDFGGASYSLYLIHLPILETLRATASAFPIFELATPIGATIGVLLSCAAAMLAYYKLEIPLLHYLRMRLQTSARLGDPIPA